MAMGSPGLIVCAVGIVLYYAIGTTANAIDAMSYDTIVIGLGASGTAAASRLARAGKRVLALEAQGRVGGRVHTVPFGDGLVELGAEWIHGTEGSKVYELAMEKNVSIIPQELDFEVFRSDGSVEDQALMNELVNFCLEAVEHPDEQPEPMGEFISRKVREYVKSRHPTIDTNGEFMIEFLNFMDLVINNYESSDSWNEVTTFTNYEELGGNQHMSWHRNGYKTVFDILLNTHRSGPGLTHLTLRVNTEVTLIQWNPETSSDVTVTCRDGTVYRASNVIVTPSLGVLKESHQSLFTPPLPKEKVDIIDNMSIGVMDKVEMLFPHPWWPQHTAFVGFIWREKERKKIQPADWWMTKIFGVSCSMGNGKVLTVWTSGNGAKLVETLPEEIVKRKVMEVIRLFMGKKYIIPEPVDMLRSTWYSNPFTRGSYSFDNLSTPQHPNARSILSQPLYDSRGVPKVMFAGEATNLNHFSTVHGAIETGFREADRILNVTSKI